MENINIENDENLQVKPSSLKDMNDLLEDNALYFRRIFSKDDLDLQIMVDEFLQYGDIEDNKCFSKTTKNGYITYIAFTSEEAWKASTTHADTPQYKIQSTDHPINA